MAATTVKAHAQQWEGSHLDAEAVANIGNRPGQDHECQAGEELGEAKECLAAAIKGG